MIEGGFVSRWTTIGDKVSVTQWCGVDEVKGGSCGRAEGHKKGEIMPQELTFDDVLCRNGFDITRLREADVELVDDVVVVQLQDGCLMERVDVMDDV